MPEPKISTAETLLDVTGLQCPLPVLRTRKKLQAMQPGSLLRVKTTDPISRIDMPHFCMEMGHELMESIERGEYLEFLIRRGRDER
jgi:tRNA 2-thiouridine synthesizing protein A